MTMNTLPKFADAIEMTGNVFTAISTLKTLATGATNGSVIEMLSVTSDDSVATNLELWIADDSAGAFQIATIPIAAYSGTNGSAEAVNGLNTTNVPFLPANAHTNKIINLKAGWFLKAKVEVLSTGDSRTITTVCGIRNY